MIIMNITVWKEKQKFTELWSSDLTNISLTYKTVNWLA